MRFLPLLIALLLVPVAAGATPPGLGTAQRACKAQGLTMGSAAFTQCVQQQLGTSGSGAPTIADTKLTHRYQQQCLKRGLTKGTNAFARCLTRLERDADAKLKIPPGTPGAP
jgi:hypothetical protein